MARRQKRAEHDNNDRWLISYADFITLLFAFFVVMYSISSVNEGKYKTFGESLNVALTQQSGSKPVAINIADNKADKNARVLVDKRTASLLEQQRKMREEMAAVRENLRKVMAGMIADGQVGISQNNRGVVVDISASTLFREGQANVQPAALETLRQVAEVLGRETRSIEVEGHTDDVPIKNAQFPSNWELSAGRASSVVRILVGDGVPETRLTAVGMAANHPIEKNDTPEHRARNRRVSITILSAEFDRLKQADADKSVGE